MDILIVYFSRTQATKYIAEQIFDLLEEKHNVEILKISEKKKYHFLKLTFAPIRDTDGCSVISSPRLYIDTYLKKTPKINEIPFNLEKFDLIFLGSPVWYGRFPPPINTFIDKLEKSAKRKKMFLFITSGGGKGYQKYADILKNEIEDKGLTVIGKLHKLNASYLTKEDKKNIIDCIESSSQT